MELRDFSTADNGWRIHAAHWNGEFLTAPGGSAIRARDSRVHTGVLGPVRLYSIYAASGRIDHNAAMARGDGSRWIKITFLNRGEIHLRQNGRDVRLQAGQWCVTDMGAPYTIEHDMPVDLFAMLAPRDCLPSAVFDASARMQRPESWRSGLGRILYSSLRETLRELPDLPAAQHAALGASLLNLASLAMAERLRPEDATLRGMAATRQRIEDYIERNLRSPDLSIDRIADALRCTKRHLHKAFSTEGRTLNAYIRDRRLAACERDLVRPELASESITRISFAWGFSNSAYFSRAFRDKFGMSPRDWRRAHLTESRVG